MQSGCLLARVPELRCLVLPGEEFTQGLSQLRALDGAEFDKQLCEWRAQFLLRQPQFIDPSPGAENPYPPRSHQTPAGVDLSVQDCEDLLHVEQVFLEPDFAERQGPLTLQVERGHDSIGVDIGAPHQILAKAQLQEWTAVTDG